MWELLTLYLMPLFSVTARLEILNRKAGSLRHWAAVRYSSSLLRQMVDSISPFVTQILVNGKQVRDAFYSLL